MASWRSYGRFYSSPCSIFVPSAGPDTGLKESVQGTEEAENGFFFPLDSLLCHFSFLNWIRGSSEEHECWYREKEETCKEKTGVGLHISVATHH